MPLPPEIELQTTRASGGCYLLSGYISFTTTRKNPEPIFLARNHHREAASA
jgi:hypothetical protein